MWKQGAKNGLMISRLQGRDGRARVRMDWDTPGWPDAKRYRVRGRRCMHSRSPPGMFLSPLGMSMWMRAPCTGRSPVSWAKSVGFQSCPLALSAPSALPILVHSLVQSPPSTQLKSWGVSMRCWANVMPPSARMTRKSDSAILAMEPKYREAVELEVRNLT